MPSFLSLSQTLLDEEPSLSHDFGRFRGFISRITCWFGLVLCGQNALGADVPLVALKTAEGTYTGRIQAHDPREIWLQFRTGELKILKKSEVTDFRKTGSNFSALSAGELRDQLRRELDSSYDIVGTGAYLVAGPKSVVRDYAQTFEDHYRGIRSYFSVRGFSIGEPEFPLVAIVFPNQQAFAKYAKRDSVVAGAGLKGYYSQLSNRITLFHEGQIASLENRLQYLALKPARSVSLPPTIWANTDGDLHSTMIHEATHQVAFNLGLHTRTGHNPRWVAEGLATVFEAPGILNPNVLRAPSARWNQSRLTWFREYTLQRRKTGALQEFTASDGLFESAPLDAYSQAWAFSFFLLETQPRKFQTYLKIILAHPVGEEITPAIRRRDFEQAFGTDWPLLEAQFQRFIDGLR